QGAHQQIAPPAGEGVPPVEGNGRGGDGGHPAQYRELPAGHGGRQGRRLVVVAVSPADERPAVVVAGEDAVELVAAPGAVLRGPEIARGIEGDAEGRPVAEAPDVGVGTLSTDKGAVLRHGAVVVEAEDLAVAAGEVLCLGTGRTGVS